MYDLHTHTYCSDGTDSPAELVRYSHDAGLDLLALTDHDTVMGCAEALAEAQRVGLPFICGSEIEAEYKAKLHILALGVDPEAKCLTDMLHAQEQRRIKRNEMMLIKLSANGYNVLPYYREGIGCSTRTHIANALVEGGYALNTPDAFNRLIGRGASCYVACKHPTMQQVIDCIKEAGGVAVLAHPHKMRCDHRKLVKSLAECGLWGVECYYPGMPPESTAYFKALAEEFGLAVTCGSDHHGGNRPGVMPGCAWRDVPELESSYEFIRRFAL